MFKKLIEFSDYEINEEGVVRRVADKKELTIHQHPSKSIYVTFRVDRKYRCRCINVLLEETFGDGAAVKAGYTQPDMKRVAVQRELANRPRSGKSLGDDANPHRNARKCHDCGKPSKNQYRCQKCWRKVRGFGFGEEAGRSTYAEV